MPLEFKATRGTLRGPLGFRFGPIRQWIHNWLVRTRAYPAGECTLFVKVDGQKATLTLIGKATAGIPKPDMTLQIIDNGRVIASRTWERVEIGVEYSVSATVTEADDHYAEGVMSLSNIVGTSSYTAEASYEIKPPPPPKPLTVTLVDYTATPDGWVSLNGSVTGGSPPYEITIDWGDGTVDRNPEFWRHQYQASGTYTVTVTAVDSTGAIASDSIDVTVKIELPPERYTLTIAVVEGNGTTDPEPGEYTYPAGETVTVTAIPGEGYGFGWWTLDGVSMGGNPITITMDRDHTLEAHFITPPAKEYTLTISSGRGGYTDPPSGTYSYASSSLVTVKAIPDYGYVFSHWLLDGEIRTENPITVHMDSDHTLTAYFTPAVLGLRLLGRLRRRLRYAASRRGVSR